MKKTLLLILLFIVSFNSYSQKEKVKNTKGSWEFNISPNIYIVSVTDDFSPKAENPLNDVSFSNISDNLGFNTIFQGEISNGKWSIITEYTYLFLKKNDEVKHQSYPYGSSSIEEVKAKLKEQVIEISIGYKFYKVENFNLDALVGFRNFTFKKEIETPKPENINDLYFRNKVKLLFNEPFVGVRFNAHKKKWKNNTRIDIGGFGIGSVLTYKFNINFGYEIFNFLSTHIGYQGYIINYNEDLSTTFKIGSQEYNNKYYYKHAIFTRGLFFGLDFQF